MLYGGLPTSTSDRRPPTACRRWRPLTQPPTPSRAPGHPRPRRGRARQRAAPRRHCPTQSCRPSRPGVGAPPWPPSPISTRTRPPPGVCCIPAGGGHVRAAPPHGGGGAHRGGRKARGRREPRARRHDATAPPVRADPSGGPCRDGVAERRLHKTPPWRRQCGGRRSPPVGLPAAHHPPPRTPRGRPLARDRTDARQQQQRRVVRPPPAVPPPPGASAVPPPGRHVPHARQPERLVIAEHTQR